MYPDRDIFEPDGTQLGIDYSAWSKHGGKWRDKRRDFREWTVNGQQQKHEASS